MELYRRVITHDEHGDEWFHFEKEQDMFEVHLTEEQYAELSQFWHEFTVLGPKRDEMGLDRTGVALSFSQWIDSDEDEPEYGLPEILAFFDEKARREGPVAP